MESQASLIDRIVQALQDEPTFLGLFLAGSLGRGAGDAFSDIDLVGVVEPETQSFAVLRWIQLLEGIEPVVFWNQRGSGPLVLNAITQTWQRCDLALLAPPQFATRTQDAVQPLIDRQGLYATLPRAATPREPDPARVRHLVDEFLRVLGLLHVVIGRSELVNAVGGAGLLRDLLADLMIEARAPLDRGGVLHLARVLAPEDIAVLTALPYPRPEATETIRAHHATAQAFLPRARALATSIGMPWPVRFEDATLRLLASSLPVTPGVDWPSLRTMG